MGMVIGIGIGVFVAVLVAVMWFQFAAYRNSH